MKRLIAAITLLSTLLILLYASSRQQLGWYTVIDAADGDTIIVNMHGVHERVRLIGIDTPETLDPRKPVQCFGPEASEFTKKLKGTKVRLQADPLSSNRDRYDRLLRYVYTPDNTFYNLELVRNGYAKAYTGFLLTEKNAIENAEQMARSQNAGLWSRCANQEAEAAAEAAPTLRL